jgi:hypothetical protein
MKLHGTSTIIYKNKERPDFRENVVLGSHCIGCCMLIVYCFEDNSDYEINNVSLLNRTRPHGIIKDATNSTTLASANCDLNIK